MRYTLYITFIVIGLTLLSCKDKVICPAFQSTYILNDSLRMAKYSLFGTDSLPKYQVASRRNKYGIGKKYSFFNHFRKKNNLKTAPKENWLGPPAKDPLFLYPEDNISHVDEGDFLASDFADSLSTGVVPNIVAVATVKPKKYKYRYDQRNPYSTEQIYYNKYFGDYLVNKRPPQKIKKEISTDDFLQQIESDTIITTKKRWFGNFFRKKKKNKRCSA